MLITPVECTLALAESGLTRSAGVHVSDLYNSLYRALEPNRYKDSPPNPVRLAMGLAWEVHVERVMKAAGWHVERPPEQKTVEGVAFSPDLIISHGGIRGGEIKWTTMSDAPLDDPKFAKWHTQAKAYGYHLGLPLWTFFVCFANGDYKANREPVFRQIDVEYTAKEMETEWAVLLNFGRQQGLL